MLERALPVLHSAFADEPAIRESADKAVLWRKLRDGLLWLLRALGDFFAKGGPLS
jgi:hypothetical protein